MSDQEDKLLKGEDDNLMQDHQYDGIQELDNDLPSWWVALFIFTVIFGLVYLTYYWLDIGPGQEEEYAAEVARHEQAMERRKKAKEAEQAAKQADKSGGNAEGGASGGDAADSGPMEITSESIARGKNIFTGQICHTCHKPDGGGLIGPNLTDSHFIHGDSIEAMVKIIEEGNVAKGMTPWKGILTDRQIFDVASYVHSLKGTNVPGGKPPEGELIKQE